MTDNIAFDPAAIEQMKVEFAPCARCDGEGMITVRGWWFDCPECGGTGVVPKEKEV